jgi:hypothetical protein
MHGRKARQKGIVWRQIRRQPSHTILHSETDPMVSESMEGDGDRGGEEGSVAPEKTEETLPPPATVSPAQNVETTSVAAETLPPAAVDEEKPLLQNLEEKQELTPDEFELRVRGLRNGGDGLTTNTFLSGPKGELKRKVTVESVGKAKRNKLAKSADTEFLTFD